MQRRIRRLLANLLTVVDRHRQQALTDQFRVLDRRFEEDISPAERAALRDSWKEPR